MIDTLAISPSNVVRSSCARMACCMCAHHLRSICLCVLTVTTGRARGSAGAVLITNLGQPCSAKQPSAARAVLDFNRGKPRQRRQRWRGGSLRSGWFVARHTLGAQGESSLTLADGIVPCPEGEASMESRRSEWYVWLHKARRDDGQRHPYSSAQGPIHHRRKILLKIKIPSRPGGGHRKPSHFKCLPDRDDHARELAAQQQDFNENPLSDEHLQIRWVMMAKSELQEGTTDEEASKALHDLSWIEAKSTVMVARNPAFRQKAPGIRGGVWGEVPRFCLFFFIFFPVKIT